MFPKYLILNLPENILNSFIIIIIIITDYIYTVVILLSKPLYPNILSDSSASPNLLFTFLYKITSYILTNYYPNKMPLLQMSLDIRKQEGI